MRYAATEIATFHIRLLPFNAQDEADFLKVSFPYVVRKRYNF